MKKLFAILVLGLIFSGSIFAKETNWGVFNVADKKGGGLEAIIALCLNEENLNKVTLSYFYNLSEYKENASFRDGDCNYVVDRLLNPRLFEFLIKTKLNKGKYVIKKKYIEKHVDWTSEIYYVTPEGKFIEVVSLVLLNEPSQTQEVVEKSDKKKKKLTGKPLPAKKLVSFILNNVITIDYDGKKESYKFEKIERKCQEPPCWEFFMKFMKIQNLLVKERGRFTKWSNTIRA